MKVFVADRDPTGLENLSTSLNKNRNQCIWTAEVNVADWDSQRTAFEEALEVFDGRIDYVFPIAGIGERRSFPNRPHSTGFEKPDLSVIEVDEIGVIYTAWLGVQHFRRQKKNQHGWKGKSKLCSCTQADSTNSPCE
jgi:NAD(P)-dependent dehydrogenase (short-subunit alcohol dehydrogenase family)